MPTSSVCLLLSSDYQALRFINWQHAFKLVLTEKAEIVREFKNKIIRTVSQAFNVPAVIRLLKRFSLRSAVKLSRKNILIRDRYCCRYCGRKGTSATLTVDHILPRSRGGGFSWENIITSCVDCNNQKGDRTPEEARMSIRGGPPQKLEMYEYLYRVLGSKGDIEEWRDFLPK